MTTSHSPLRKIKAQADNIAVALKAAARGEKIANDPAGKIAAALTRDAVTFGIVMDDKIVKVTMPWTIIRETDEAGISEWIVGHMRGESRTEQ